MTNNRDDREQWSREDHDNLIRLTVQHHSLSDTVKEIVRTRKGSVTRVVETVLAIGVGLIIAWLTNNMNGKP